MRATFTDGAATYTVNDQAAFDGTTLLPDLRLARPQFTPAALTYTSADRRCGHHRGATKTYIVNTTGR